MIPFLALVRRGDIREARSKRLVVLGHAVGKNAVQRSVVREAGVGGEQRVGCASDRQQLNVGHIVGQTSAIREATGVTGKHTQLVIRRSCAGRNAGLERGVKA